MCTVTWQRNSDGYQLFCNRDELLNRKPALPPALEPFSGAKFLAPRDADRGGTWIAVNEFGISLCLLNGANLSQAHQPPVKGTYSRGWLVTELARFRSTAEMGAYLQYTPLYDYSCFTLAIIAPDEQTLLVEWDGYVIRFERRSGRSGLISSSSVDPAGARVTREALFAKYLQEGRSLADFHAYHGEGASAQSPCMHRADAETVSFSRIDVTAGEASLFYAPGPPCRAAAGSTLRLPRV